MGEVDSVTSKRNGRTWWLAKRLICDGRFWLFLGDPGCGNTRGVGETVGMRVLLLFFLLSTGVALGCATFVPEHSFAELADETALIVWDEKTHTQHFIRRAMFRTDAPSLGFIVPTPTRPEFGEVDDKIFQALDQMSSPQVVEESVPQWTWACSRVPLNCSAGMPMEQPPVRVLDRLQVAGYEVAVLRAVDTAALGAWLKENGYQFTTAGEQWVEPYVKDGYVLSAFKYTGKHSETVLNAPAIRMSFASPSPFYPYREPRVERHPGYRHLRLYLLGSGRYKGMLESDHWSSAEVPFSAPLEVLPQPLKELSSQRWLTVFNDHSSARPSGLDLEFVLDPDQTEIRPPDRIVHRGGHIFLEPILLLFGGLFWVFRKRQRRAG